MYYAKIHGTQCNARKLRNAGKGAVRFMGIWTRAGERERAELPTRRPRIAVQGT
ncbi:unnamed protein product, partial [Nesidiocoris tenuis]